MNNRAPWVLCFLDVMTNSQLLCFSRIHFLSPIKCHKYANKSEAGVRSINRDLSKRGQHKNKTKRSSSLCLSWSATPDPDVYLCSHLRNGLIVATVFALRSPALRGNTPAAEVTSLPAFDQLG